MKKLIIVSTGRCGTTRLAEILRTYSPNNFEVVHQVGISRTANVIGNLMLKCVAVNWLKKVLFNTIIPKNKEAFITTDPLVSLVIPNEYVTSKDVAIIQLVRERESFAKSFYQFTRLKKMSFIAHNFVPFWQPKVYLLENWLKGEQIIQKYVKVCDYKELVFEELYSSNPHYTKISMKEAFDNGKIIPLISEFFNYDFNIPNDEFNKKVNESK